MKAIRKSTWLAGTAAIAVGVLAACGGGTSGGEGGDGGDVTIEFAQWWGTELPDGSFQKLIDRFEEENPGIKVQVNSQPYSNTKDQLVAGAASGTMPDVVGLDGNWIYDFEKQGALANLAELWDATDFDVSKVNPIEMESGTYMIPVENFAYPLYVNNELMEQAGVDEIPTTWSEFEEAAKKISDLGDGISGWVLPLSLESAVGIKNDFLSWYWASGGRIIDDAGNPDLTNPELVEVLDFINGLREDGVIAPGIANLQEQDKVEEFQNGRVGMMISPLAHINLLDQNADLDFSVGGLPVKDGYSGVSGVTFASWGIGVAEASDHKEEAWKLIDFLLQADVNEELSQLANAFPGHADAKPDFITEDERIAPVFDVWNDGTPVDEFIGLPVSEQLMRTLDEQVQRALSGGASSTEALEAAQATWEDLFESN